MLRTEWIHLFIFISIYCGLQVLFDFILFILEDLKSTKAPK